jgi:hypothetical protein
VSVLLPLVPQSALQFQEMPQDFQPEGNSEELIVKELRTEELSTKECRAKE